MWQFLFPCQRQTEKKHWDRRVDDVAVTSCHMKKQAKTKQKQKQNGGKKTRHELPLQSVGGVMEGSSRQRESLKKGFCVLEPCENPLETFVVLVRSESTVARPV